VQPHRTSTFSPGGTTLSGYRKDDIVLRAVWVTWIAHDQSPASTGEAPWLFTMEEPCRWTKPERDT